MPELDDADKEVLAKVLQSQALQNLIGAEEWDLSEEEEMRLWQIIEKVGGL